MKNLEICDLGHIAASMKCRRPWKHRYWRIPLGLALYWGVGACASHAQFLRVGPFDFNAKARLEGVYSTNVEGERPSQSEGKSMKDYYLVAGLDALATADLSPNTKLDIETGVSLEKHFIRKDLDTQPQSPFGDIDLSGQTTMGHYTLDYALGVRRTSMTGTDTYVPGDRKLYDVHTILDNSAQLNWAYRDFRLMGGYSYTRERHDSEQFKDGDKDQYTWNFLGNWQAWRYAGLFYSYDRELTDMVEEQDEDWTETERMGLDGTIPLQLLRHPKVYYQLGIESKHGKHDDPEKRWYPMHTVRVEDDLQLSSTIKLNGFAQYENKILDDDVAFTYGAKLEHELSRTANQVFSAQREPVETLGSTKSTDSTKFDYLFNKRDLFIYNLNMTFNIAYSIDTPLAQGETPTERKWTYNWALDHVRQLTRNLRRTLGYKYTWEHSNLDDENMDENRVTLQYEYFF